MNTTMPKIALGAWSWGTGAAGGDQVFGSHLAEADLKPVFDKAMENIKPTLEVKSRRVGGSNYQVPIEVSPSRSQALGLRWLVKYARLRGGKGMAVNLANEIIDASNGTGAAVKKREDTHRMAEANKAFAHYRW